MITESAQKYRGVMLKYGVDVPFYNRETFNTIFEWIQNYIGKKTTWCWSGRRNTFNTNGQEIVYFYFLKQEHAFACSIRWSNSTEGDQAEYLASVTSLGKPRRT